MLQDPALVIQIDIIEIPIRRSFAGITSVIDKNNRPTLVISPNKVLAAHLYAEFKSFFPNNAVEYFISYLDKAWKFVYTRGRSKRPP